MFFGKPASRFTPRTPDVSPKHDRAFRVFGLTITHDLNVQAKSLENLKPFQVGNPGGPGRTPEKVPTFLRRLTETDDPAEVERLILSLGEPA